MRRRIICIILAVFIVCVSLSGCRGSGGDRDLEGVSKSLLKLEDYTCDVKMLITNNISTEEYTLRHFYKSPDRYRLEIVSPRELEGQVTIYNGRNAYIYHPGIRQYLVTEDFTDSVEYYAFIGSFIEYIRMPGKVKASSEAVGDRTYYVFEFQLSDSNSYINTEKLWLDPKKAVPVKAEIYGSDGRKTVEVYYYNFVCNSGLKDGDFDIIQNNQ